MNPADYIIIPAPILAIQANPPQPMRAFHGSQELKAFYLGRVKAHREADELIKGTYWENGKGCAVGCSVHSGSHSRYQSELGIPRVLARLEDGIFEGLPNGKAKVWPEAFLEIIPVNADLSGCFYVFMEWLLIDPRDGVIRFAKTERTKKVIQDVGDLFKRRNSGETITSDQWWPARRAAYAAAAYAAYAADAADAAAAAAYAANAAADAAYAANAADDGARGKARIRQSEKLIEILHATKP